MKIEDMYTMLDGDYKGVIGRLRSEKLIQKFVLKFLNDPSYDELCKALSEDKAEEAFRAAHTLKGVSQNLGFENLHKSSAELTEMLRNGIAPEAHEFLSKVTEDYKKTTDAIQSYQKELA